MGADLLSLSGPGCVGWSELNSLWLQGGWLWKVWKTFSYRDWKPGCALAANVNTVQSLLAFSPSFLRTWNGWGDGGWKASEVFVLFAFFPFLSCTWLIQQADGKYWAIYLTTLFLNFLISNAGLFVCSLEIFASTQNVNVDIQFRYCISDWLVVSLLVETTYIRHICTES